MGIENPVHLLFIAAVALVVLGPRRLPELARSLGKGIREFRDAMSDGSAAAGGVSHASTPTAPLLAPEEVATVSDVPIRPTASADAPLRESVSEEQSADGHD